MALTLDWKAIRPLEGSRAKGFEELCAQLARAESPADARFERKGTPDAGIECYSIFADGREWGWQAKYIDGLGEAQWPQLDDSVKTALEKHPKLIRYFICAPLDRSDARIEGRRSAKQRWDDHVEKWLGWASDHGMSISFEWWGSHELLDLLVQPKHTGRVRFWFDVYGFDKVWFDARLDEAVKTAGPRYTPEIHVDLPIAAEFEAFGRTEQFFDHIKAQAKGVRKAYQTFGYSVPKAELTPSLTETIEKVSTGILSVLNALSEVKVQPIDKLPFLSLSGLVTTIEAAAAELGVLLLNEEHEYAENNSKNMARKEHSSRQVNPYGESRHRLYALESELRSLNELLIHAESVAGSGLMIIKGDAGTGKTHLLCDVARHRVAAGRPTILLMGQQFVVSGNPWSQVFHQLDLHEISAEKFVGAFEASAQAAGCRALVLIDAINEGAGRLIWPDHLSAFLTHFERSPWIGVLLSVRTSYEEIVIPEEIRTRTISKIHHGFADHEYDATRTFFGHYDLELPSTPLLTPEFRNPLFLKTLCRGLSATGERRLPRGFKGITVTFNMYLSAVNQRLASMIDFNPKRELVRQALEEFAKLLVSSGDRWLSLSKAEEVINALLPRQNFERSLYRGLVTEGVLVEEAIRRRGSDQEEVVFIAYERFADHIVTQMLLETHLDTDNPTVAFAVGGPLAFIWDDQKYVPSGLIEAMCIQVPERTGQELVQLAPELLDLWSTGNAFRQSIIWRDPGTFSESTREVLNSLIQSDQDLRDTHDVIVTVATLPSHPFNARFLDERLRKDCMPDRDAFWSTYLHHTYGSKGAVDRLVDWASSVSPEINLDDETVNLSAITLTWMLATSNRFLRDRATKALVSLLTSRFDAVARLVEQFSDVDDPYIAERVYAVAYGVVTRSNEARKVGKVAKCVYDRVFATGTPPAHILLRDYARGVIERALHLGSIIDIVAEKIRPPYESTWPHIPSEEEIKPLMPDWSRGAHDSGEPEWSRNRIGSSVMNDDFALYVIGTNSSSISNEWLSIKLKEPIWQSAEEKLGGLVSSFSAEAREAWADFDAVDRELKGATFRFVLPELMKQWDNDNSSTLNGATNTENQIASLEETVNPAIDALKKRRDTARSVFTSLLSQLQTDGFAELYEANEAVTHQSPPGFELQLIQRYILWRVFDLGWTTERFGEFDRFSIGYHGRGASKVERIGKKYQWIGYHEILAYISDHYQFRQSYIDGSGRSYDGPWQGSHRDIDPTCTLRTPRGGTTWDGHRPAWWGAALFEDWANPGDPRGWVRRQDNIPKLEELLCCTHPTDKSHWFNVQGNFNWRQQPPVDREYSEVERRELRYDCTGYLIHSQDLDSFMAWAKGTDLWEGRMPNPPEVYQMFLGEHGWSPAAHFFEQPYYGADEWTFPGRGCPARIKALAFYYKAGAGGFDCSIDESFHLSLPTRELIDGMRLRWNGVGADLLDTGGKLAAFDPTAFSDGPSALLIREDQLRTFLAHEGLAVVWVIIGEKQVVGGGFRPTEYVTTRISGAYVLQDTGLVGFMNFDPYPPI